MMRNGGLGWLFAPLVVVACGPGATATDASTDAALVTMCGPGTHRSGNECDPDPSDGGSSLVCGARTHAVNGVCVPDGTTTGTGGLDDPSTWRTNVAVTPRSIRAAAEPQMAVDSHGNIFVACMATSAAGTWGVRMFRSSDQGATFSTVSMSDGAARNVFLGDVTVAVDPTDRVFFGWIHYATDPSGMIASDLMVAQSTDGIHFGVPQQVSDVDPTLTFNDRPWLALAPDGSMYVSWTNGAGDLSGGGARYAHSSSGAPFDAAQSIFDSDPNLQRLDEGPLAFDAMGGLVAASSDYGYDARTGSFTYTASSWRMEAGSWVSQPFASLVYEPPAFQFETYVVLTSDRHGVITAAYLNGASRDVTLFVSRSIDGARSWSTPVRVEGRRALASTITLPWITHDETDRIHLLWLDNRYGSWVPYTSWSADGVVFSAPERIGDAPFVEDGSPGRWIGDFASIVVRDRRRYAVWTDTRSGSSRVFFSTSWAP